MPLDPPPPAPEPSIFRLADVEQAVTEIAVEVLRARGEPARGERLLGEVLVGLDRTGDLRRLTGTRTFAESEARGERALDALGYMAAGSYLLGGTPLIEAPEVDGIELEPPAVEPDGAELTEAATSTDPGATGPVQRAGRDRRGGAGPIGRAGRAVVRPTT